MKIPRGMQRGELMPHTLELLHFRDLRALHTNRRVLLHVLYLYIHPLTTTSALKINIKCYW